MAGLKRINDQIRFRRQCERASETTGVTVWFDQDRREDDAFEDDGCLHVRRFQLHAYFGIGQDAPGQQANEWTRTIMSTVGLKRKIGKRVLVEEECEECEGDGYTTCDQGGEHPCGNCGGSGLVEPEDYK